MGRRGSLPWTTTSAAPLPNHAESGSATGRVPGRDKWMRREWHEAAARDRWSEGRTVEWVGWKERRSRGGARSTRHQLERVPIAESKVWVGGHVPEEFLDWAERHWSHGDETRAMLSGWGFGVWER